MLRYHYDRLSAGYIEALREASDSGEIGKLDPEVAAYALMGIGELIGMRWILWGDGDRCRRACSHELERIIRCILEADSVRRVGLAATASYLPERWMTAAEIARARRASRSR